MIMVQVNILYFCVRVVLANLLLSVCLSATTDISYQDRYDELFSGTKIYDLNLPTHNSYHVINFDFSAVSTGNLNKLLTSFFVDVADGIRDFKRRYKDFVFDYSDIDKTDAATMMSDCKRMFLSKRYSMKQQEKNRV